MPTYKWDGFTRDSKHAGGEIEAETLELACEALRKRDMFVNSINESKPDVWSPKKPAAAKKEEAKKEDALPRASERDALADVQARLAAALTELEETKAFFSTAAAPQAGAEFDGHQAERADLKRRFPRPDLLDKRAAEQAFGEMLAVVDAYEGMAALHPGAVARIGAPLYWETMRERIKEILLRDEFVQRQAHFKEAADDYAREPVDEVRCSARRRFPGVEG